METASFQNLTMLISICANTTEILGCAAGAPLLFLWWIPKASGLEGFGLKIFLLGAGMVGLGLSARPVLNSFLSNGNETGLIASLAAAIVFVLAAIALTLAVYFMPTFFAVKVLKKEKKSSIVLMNLIGFLPIFWLIALIWSCTPDKERIVPEPARTQSPT